jgi:DMSO/TMAO reductase YedYZ molybdopterin-dependent catalytic subunit
VSAAGVRVMAAAAGVVSGGVAMAAAHLAAGVVRPDASPVLAVGGLVVDSTPRQVKDFAIHTFGSADKPVLLGGIGIVLALLAAAIGLLARRRTDRGMLAVIFLGVIGAIAVLSRPSGSVVDLIPTALGTVAGCYTLRYLIGLLPSPSPATRSPVIGSPTTGASPAGTAATGAPVAGADRRRFLAGVGGLAGAAVVAGLGGTWLAGLRFSAKGSRDAVRLPRPASAAAVPASADPGAGAVAYLTRNRDFYRVDTALTVPQVAAETWSLRVHGKVREEFSISYAELIRMPMIERVITLACVSNEVGGEYVGTARWLGVPVRTVLARAGIDPSADQLVCRSKDAMTIGAPTSIVLDGRDSLFAVGMNGDPLPLEHGFPVRMVVPGLYGYCSACKWIVDVEASTFGDYDAYWIRQGWARVAEIRTESRIDTPRDGGTVPAGPAAVAGVAWAQHRGISAVEVSVDGGAWAPARLASEPTKDAWRLWTYTWDARPGKHLVSVRATDGTGAVQTAAPAEPYPSGATGYHSIHVEVR